MSVSSQDNKVIFTGTGSSGPFDFSFRVYASSDLIVQKYEIATGIYTTLTETTDYVVTLGTDYTGSLVLMAVVDLVSTIVPLPVGYKLIITRTLPITQEIAYIENDKFPAATHEEGLDRGVMIDQQLQEQIARAVVSDPTQSTQVIFPLPVANKVVGWNAAGTGLENKTEVDADSVLAAQTAASDAVSAKVSAESARDIAVAAAESAEAITGVTIATQAEAEAGTSNTVLMTPLRVKQEVQKASAVAIPIENIPTVTIAKGGTGQTTASAAINALLPAQSGKTNYVLSSTGTAAQWSDISIAQAGIDTLLPAQTGNSGAFLTTNGTNASWGVGGVSYFASDFIFASANTARGSNANSTPVKLKEMKIGIGGTIRVYFELNSGTGTTPSSSGYNPVANAQIYKNGSAVGTLRQMTYNATWGAYSEDLVFVAGDLIQIYAWETVYTDRNAIVQNFQLRGTGTVPIVNID